MPPLLRRRNLSKENRYHRHFPLFRAYKFSDNNTRYTKYGVCLKDRSLRCLPSLSPCQPSPFHRWRLSRIAVSTDEFRCRKVKPDRVDPEGAYRLNLTRIPSSYPHVLPNLANREQTDSRQFVASSLPASLASMRSMISIGCNTS